MKHLLLISNISSENEQLLEYAAHFCKHYKCKLHVLHISEYNVPVLVSSLRYYNENGISFNKTDDEKITKKISKVVDKIIDREFLQIDLKKGNQEQILNSFITNNFIDMIMLGNKDLENESDFVNHKNILINVIDTPLIVIPEYEIFKPYKNFNFLTTHTVNDLKEITKLSTLFSKAKIKLIHYEKGGKELSARAEKWIELVKNKWPKKIEYLLIDEEIKRYIQLENTSIVEMCDAFVFTTQKRKFWSRLFDPSTTLSYLAGLEIPSVIFKKQILI